MTSPTTKGNGASRSSAPHLSSSSPASSSAKKRIRSPTPSPPPSSSASPLPPLTVDDSPDVWVASSDVAAVSEEYRVWKKNSPYLYDVVLSSELDWPSLTVQFLPDRQRVEGREYSVQRLLLGTQTDGSEGNYLIIAEVKLPSEDAVIDAEEFSRQAEDHERVVDATAAGTHSEPGGWGAKGKSGKVEVVQRIPHPSEVNRARYMPQNADVIATRGVEGPLYVFDRTRYASKPSDDGWRCDVLLQGHEAEGYGLAWSVLQEGRLASCAADGRICVWDIGGGREKETRVLAPTLTWTAAHGPSVVNDVTLHCTHPHLLASGADDGVVKVWDMRERTTAPAAHALSGHQGPVNGVEFCPLSAYALASASDDHSVCVWDLRQPSAAVHVLRHHHDSVLQVAWAPFDADVLGSVSADRRVNVYELSREEKEEGGQLLFMHGGHTDKVGEMSWNPIDDEPWMAASVADNNVLQLWQIAENIVDSGDDDDDGVVEEQTKKSKTDAH